MTNKFETFKLNNGETIPAVGFGTWQIFLNSVAREAVTDALGIGYRLIDTARIYGNEKGVGRSIRNSGLSRQDIFLTTKFFPAPQGYGWALKAFDASLKRLKMDYVDLYLIHFPRGGARSETWRAFEEIYKSGRAKAVGVSNYGIDDLNEILETSAIVPVVNQIELNCFNYTQQRPVVDFCHLNGIVIEAYSPLAQASQMRHPYIMRLAEKYHKTYAQVMLRWCVQHKAVPIPKSTHTGRIRENFEIFDFEISQENMNVLDKIS